MVTYTSAAKRLFSEADENIGSASKKKRRITSAKTRKQDDVWNSMYDLMVAFKDESSHCNVPYNYKDRKLARWVKTQRNRKKAGKLLPECIKKLDSLGFVWVLKEKDTFNSMYERLCAYKNQNGDCNVSKVYKADPKLGRWVNDQRVLKKAGKLLPDRIERLELIGFVWVRHKLDTFDSMCDRLAAYKKETGHCKVPPTHKNHPKLGRWVSKQRHLKKTGKLVAERIQKLNSMGFVWSAVHSATVELVTVKKEEPAENKPKLKVWVEDTGDPNYV